MSLLIKLAAYLIGALALLSTLVVPASPVATTTQVVATTQKVATSTTPVATTSSKITEKKVKKIVISKPLPVVSVKPELPTTIISLPPPPPATTTPTFSWNEINKKTRAALVNIICTTKRGGSFDPVSGSGVMIDSRGVILTNAHVAEYFLLKDYLVPNFVECLIRTGAPAKNTYRARLLYLAPQWVEANAREITASEATGTGENDFALLLITESVNPMLFPLPLSFPAIALSHSDESLRTLHEALVAAYPAGFLGGITIQKELYPVSSVAETGEIYSFGSNTPDLVTVIGSPLSQHGASGGAVVGSDGQLIGLIATASTGATTGERELHAITPSHLEKSFRERNNFSLQEMFAQGNLATLADEFNIDVAPQLRALLENVLNKK